MSPTPSRLRAALFLLLLALGGAAPLGAQQRERDCRCVDADGREIENCFCFRAPQVPDFSFAWGVPRARIGVTLEEHPDGARVREVREGSPAAEAGLAAGDVITRVGGQSLREALADARRERALDETGDVAVQRLMALARDWEPGMIVELEVLRNGERRTLRMEAEAAPPAGMVVAPGGPSLRMVWPEGRARILEDSARALRFRVDSLVAAAPFVRVDSLVRLAMARARGPCPGGPGMFVFGADCVGGVRLMPLGPELGEYFGTTRGALVADVGEGSSLGLRPGDVILSVEGRAVDGPTDATRILGSYREDEEIAIRIRRRGEEMEVRGRR